MKKALLVGIVLSLICAIVGCGQKEKAQYTLTFYSEGEVVHTLTAEEGLTIALREEADDPVKAEDEKNTYTFAGWTLGEEGELTESYTVTGDASFYATFTATPIVYYSVTFVDVDEQGTRTVLSEQQVRAGKCAEIPAQSPEHEGYTFIGWSPDPSAAVTQDTEYVAQYDVNTYKLTLSTPIGETEAQYGFGAELLLEEPELPAFLSFADWYADEDFTQPFALEKMPARDVQVYAKCEFDFGAAKLSVGEGLVYGGNNTASVEGLPADEKIVYTYLWKDGENTETAESYALLHAGRHELSVTVKATFNEVEGEKTFTSTVDVAKKALTGTIEGVEASVVYGTRVAPMLKVEGAVGGDEIPAAKIEIKGDKEGDPLPVGSYTVTASLPDLNDYSFETVTKQFEVVKKELTATLSAEQTTIVYGNTFTPTLTFAGFIEGENDSVVKRGADLFRYEKDGANYTEKRFEVGSYTLSVAEGALTADNYSFAAISSCTLTVQKAALTVTVQMVNESYVYGETPQASVTHTEFAYSDETETAVFGSELTPSLPAHEGKYYNVGHYTVTAGTLQAKNYEITVNTASFDVTQKAVTVALGEATAVYGDAFAISAPTVSGLLEDEQDKETDIVAALRYSCEGKELTLQSGKYGADVLFAVGAHTLTANAEGLTLDNYSLSTTNGTLTVTARPFTVSSQTTQVRDEKYEFTPKFEGSDAELFSASGKLVLKTQDAGSYIYNGSDLSASSFQWEVPLKIVHSGEEVTENFSISYDLNVTLDNSTFTVSIPEGREFVYDGQEHTFPVTANPIEGEQGTVVPIFEYTVNKEKIEGVPTFKDAGEYEVSCTITAANYNSAESSFTVNIAKAQYTVKAEDKQYTYAPDCSFADGVEVTALPGNEYTVTYSYLDSETQEAPKFTKAVENAVVSFTVSEGKNYAEYTGSYTVNVAKAQGTIDVSGVEKNYTYTGAVQTIDEGATTNNEEDGKLSYSNNTFTTVEQGNALTVKVTLSEGENYTSAEATFQIHVAKAQGTIDVSGVEKHYTYTGALQTIDKGATTNNNEGDGVLTYSSNTFTTVAEGNALTVKVTLQEGANYTGAEKTFSITVDKAEGTIDVDGVNKNYTYSGAVQTINEGATSNNKEDAQFTYSSNTFKTVAEGNALTVKVTLSEGANYTGAETTFKITVAKAQGTIDVNGVNKNYVYTGALQTIDKGATTNNNDGDGVLTYSNNTFKTVAEGNALTVKVTLKEGANYTSAEETFTIHVDKAQGTIDVNGVKKDYVYTGELQTVEGGATTNNEEDGELSYSDNTFTTVTQGNALNVKVTLSEGENYTGTETTFKIHVAKKTLERLPENVVAPEVSEQVNMVGKTLSDISLADKFTWKELGQELEIGPHAYDACYNADPENIEPFVIQITFSTRKQVITLKVEEVEADYVANATADSVDIVKFSYTDESEADCAETIGEYIQCVCTPDAKTILAVGGTYIVQWTVTVTENNYFELQYGNAKETSYHGEDVFKWKSVELDGTLYTIEDALKLLESGKMATVKFNTSFASKEVSEKLYADDSYRTVKEGATLLVPYGAADTGVVEQKQASTGHAAASPSGYVTLTLPAGELVVNGTLIVNAFRVSNSNQSGNVKGSQYGSLELAQGTKVTVKNKATFESMGFTYGEGEVFVESGATVYEPFSVPGWKGGTISAGIRKTVFPLNQFTASSLIAKTHILAGAVYSLRVALTASSSPQNGMLTFVGTGNALMILTEGQVTKYVTENDGKVHFEIAGTVNFGTMSIAVSGGEASTSGLQVPIPGHFAFDFLSGSATLPDKVALKLLPGASLTVEREATLTIAKGGALYAYGDGNYTLSNPSLSQWQDGEQSGTLKVYPNTYVKGCYRKTPTLGYDAKTPATVTVKGTLVVEDSGHFGAKPSGEEGAELRLSAAAVLTNSIKEDYSKTEDIGGFFGAFMGNKGAFFTTTFTCGDLTAGNYTYTGGEWVKA